MADKNKKRKREMLSEGIRQVIVNMFENVNDALSVGYMLGIFEREHNYLVMPESIIRDAIQEGLIYVDTIKQNGEVYLGLSTFGESMWWQRHGRQ